MWQSSASQCFPGGSTAWSREYRARPSATRLSKSRRRAGAVPALGARLLLRTTPSSQRRPGASALYPVWWPWQGCARNLPRFLRCLAFMYQVYALSCDLWETVKKLSSYRGPSSWLRWDAGLSTSLATHQGCPQGWPSIAEAICGSPHSTLLQAQQGYQQGAAACHQRCKVQSAQQSQRQ